MPDALHTTSYGERGSRVVFCHGLFGQGRNWSQIAKELAEDHRVLLVDMPHHGRSPWAETFDYLDLADQVAGLLAGLDDGDDPVALVGHSMGGKVAMLVALRHPRLVDRLCVVDVSPVDYDGSSVGEFTGYVEAMRGLDVDALGSRGDADAALSEAVPSPTIRGFLLQNLRRAGDTWRWQLNLDVLGESLRELGGWPEDRLDGVPAYDGPVLWLAGDDSDYVQDQYAASMERWFPRHRKVRVKDAGHWVHSEQPRVFVEVLRRFLDQEPAR